MDLQYDPERQAVGAMKLAAEADGPERQRWITAALAWSELSRLRGTAEHNGTEGWPMRQPVTGGARSVSSAPLSSG
jgi:ribosomal protein L4